MSYNIGQKIKNLRVERKLTQDQVAYELGMTRQRFARIESGQSDISYATLKKIADCYSVPVSAITAADEEKDLVMLFREKPDSYHIQGSVEKVVEILKTFHSHEKLYYRMKEKNSSEN
jgi:transcriptional regulator with XRE-family HTH domain